MKLDSLCWIVDEIDIFLADDGKPNPGYVCYQRNSRKNVQPEVETQEVVSLDDGVDYDFKYEHSKDDRGNIVECLVVFLFEGCNFDIVFTVGNLKDVFFRLKSLKIIILAIKKLSQ